MSYSRDEVAQANKLMKQLQKRKTVVSSDIKQEANVHSATLKKFGTEMFEEGKGSQLPDDLFNTYRVKIVKISK